MALSTFCLVALGMAVSSYATLIGAGGGFILMPLLLLLFPHDNPHELTAISLSCMLIYTFSTTAAYAKLKMVDFKSGLFFGAAALPGAVLGVVASGAVSREFFELLFAVFLIGLALFAAHTSRRESAPRKISLPSSRRGWNVRKTATAYGIVFEYDCNRLLAIPLFFALGFMTCCMGIGGSALMIPAFIYILNFPIFIATGTARFIAAILTFTATATHLGMGSFGHAALLRVVAIGIGMIIGARMGARFSVRIRRVWTFRSLAVVLALVGIRMVLAVL
ncbi:MAG: sulfite exporter TauE/SafE family protein [Syntrophobacteraceae bacterium]|nr:sulfite exporter TauE/SafE family protein [Syntrophobacteraceae bacterium]